MMNNQRPVPFVLISTNHGLMIVNRNDYRMTSQNRGYGVGYQLLNYSSYERDEVGFSLAILGKRRKYFGDNVVAIDCGANIGVHTIEWAKFMYGWGEVISFEPQEKIYYALAGNVIINNCLNVTAKNCAVGSQCGSIDIPTLNYLLPSSYGSFELKQSTKNEFIGQVVDYKKTTRVSLVSIDSLDLKRLDFIKIDVERMEEDVLQGAVKSIQERRPIMIIEIMKSDRTKIANFLRENGYTLYPIRKNLLAVHSSDPIINDLKYDKETLCLL